MPKKLRKNENLKKQKSSILSEVKSDNAKFAVISGEARRVSQVSANVSVILADLDKQFEQATKLTGSDISEACADQVNVHHHYIVLKDYLFYCDEQFFGKTRLYCVHKKTGEKREIPVEIQKKDEIKACNLCGCGKYVYLLHDSGIYKAHVAGKEPCFQKMNMDITMKRACSKKHLCP